MVSSHRRVLFAEAVEDGMATRRPAGGVAGMGIVGELHFTSAGLVNFGWWDGEIFDGRVFVPPKMRAHGTIVHTVQKAAGHGQE